MLNISECQSDLNEEEILQCHSELIEDLNFFQSTEFTTKFRDNFNLKKLTRKKGINDLQNRISNFSSEPYCHQLYSYIDELRMWGKQQIFLYKFKPADKNDTFLNELSKPAYIQENLKNKNVENVFENNICYLKSEKPILAHVYYENKNNKTVKLIFKWIMTRKYFKLVGKTYMPREIRSTSFFVVNLLDGFAEIRLQQLPPNPNLNPMQERDMYIKEINKYIDFHKFSLIELKPIMEIILKKAIFTNKAVNIVSSNKPGHLIFKNLFPRFYKHPVANSVSAYWTCKQDIIGKSKINFTLFRESNSIKLTGVVDPKKLNKILNKIYEIHEGNTDPIDHIPFIRNGIVGTTLKLVENKEKTETVLVTTGSLGAFLIWTLWEFLVEYINLKLTEQITWLDTNYTKSVVEISYIILYYGIDRIILSIKFLFIQSPFKLIKLIADSKNKKITDLRT